MMTPAKVCKAIAYSYPVTGKVVIVDGLPESIPWSEVTADLLDVDAMYLWVRMRPLPLVEFADFVQARN